MKSFLIFSAFFFTSAFHSDIFAQTVPERPEPADGFDDSYCVAAIPEPIVISSPQDYSPPKVEWLSSTMIRETIEFDPNITVEIEHGGCAHFGLGFRFIFHGESVGNLSQVEWIKRTYPYLKLIKINSFESWQKTIQDEVSKMDFSFSLEQEITINGGFSHIYFFVEEPENNVTSVELSYDRAL